MLLGLMSFALSVSCLLPAGTARCSSSVQPGLRQSVINKAVQAQALERPVVGTLPPSFVPDLTVKFWSDQVESSRVRTEDFPTRTRRAVDRSHGFLLNLNWKFPRGSTTHRRRVNLERGIRRRKRNEVRIEVGLLFDAWSSVRGDSLDAQELHALLDAFTDFGFTEIVRPKEICACERQSSVW